MGGTEVACGGSLTLVSAPGPWGKAEKVAAEGRLGRKNDIWACTTSGGILVLGAAVRADSHG